MALEPQAVVALAKDLIAAHTRDLYRNGRLGKVKRYLDGEHDMPYAPRGAKAEYKEMARKSITNWLPLISDTFNKGLWLDGYRPARSADNAKPWEYWQANGLDARQSVVHRGALEYGTAYVLVLPGTPAPLIRPLSSLRVLAMYQDDDDAFPAVALISKGTAADGSRLYEVLEGDAIHTVRAPKDKDIQYVTAETHDLGVVPLVRFRDRLDGEARGIIRPLIAIQDRINESVFALMIAIQYASFRQRWATGLAIPVDEDPGTEESPNPNYGKPVEPFEAAVDRLWATDSPDAKFGDFAQTDVMGHLKTYESTVRTLAAIAQVSPLVLLGDLVNLAADALAAVQDTTERKGAEYETLFGESWETVFRLAAKAAGDTEAASDTSAQVRWRDTEARSLASTVDALGKMAQMLMVPAEALWERVPGVTDQDIERWRELAGKADGLAALASALTRQAATAPSPAPAEAA